MSKVAVVYWSGTGNTAMMADSVAEGAKAKGAEVDMLLASEVSAASIADYSGVAFGCPSMGAEQLEEIEFQPMWDEVKSLLAGKKVALFGSYGWGDGEWMRLWEDECASEGIQGVETCICGGAPGEDAIDECKDLGAGIV